MSHGLLQTARRRNGQAEPVAKPAVIPCAIYTRKSTEDGLDRDVNSLTVQRQACEEYVRSRAAEGWHPLSEIYDDGGWSGATVNRPAFQRLLTDIEAGRVGCVVVHRVDRLSRSLLDFARLMHFFQERGVAFVSVTQNFSTADPVGRLTLNLLATFAEFEREMISARTKDKIAASRARGRWTGGTPMLGYDVRDGRLVVNDEEAPRVREIFRLYEEHRSLTRVVEEVSRRGWTGKERPRSDDESRAGRPLDKPTVYRLLANPLYAGLIRCGASLVRGEHDAIVPLEAWHRVQAHLRRNGSAGYQGERESQDALLRGLLRCGACGSRMTPTYAVKGSRRYRYYTCVTRAKRGAHACPTGHVAAGEVERQVVEEIRKIARDPALIAETVRQALRQRDELVERLKAEARALRKDLGAKEVIVRRLATVAKGGKAGDDPATRLARVQARVEAIEARLAAIPREIDAAKRVSPNEADIRSALEAFGPVWDALSPAERARIIKTLVERVTRDLRDGRIKIAFRPNGLRDFAASPDG